MTGLLDLISDWETKNKIWKNNSAHLWIDVESLSCAIISSTWSGVTNKHTVKKRNEMWRGELNNTMNRSAKRKIANKLLPNRWNKLRTSHYFIDGVGGGEGGEIGQFPNTKSCTGGTRSAAKKSWKGSHQCMRKNKEKVDSSIRSPCFCAIRTGSDTRGV